MLLDIDLVALPPPTVNDDDDDDVAAVSVFVCEVSCIEAVSDCVGVARTAPVRVSDAVEESQFIERTTLAFAAPCSSPGKATPPGSSRTLYTGSPSSSMPKDSPPGAGATENWCDAA